MCMTRLGAPTPPTPPASPNRSSNNSHNNNNVYKANQRVSQKQVRSTIPQSRLQTRADQAESRTGRGAKMSLKKEKSGDDEETVSIVDYRNDPNVKPPFSYASLICMAMKSSRNKMTLNSIYKWIRENFVYYQHADRSWQVSSGAQSSRFVTPFCVHFLPFN